MRRPSLVLATALALLAALPLGGCGRRGAPIAPEGTIFPRTYPDPRLTDPNAPPPGAPAAEQEDEEEGDSLRDRFLRQPSTPTANGSR